MVNYLLLIVLHLLGDFYLQTTKVARCKNAKKSSACGKCKKCGKHSWVNWKYLMLHSLLYIAPFVVLYFIMGAVYATAMITVLWVTHILIDTGTCYFNRKNKQTLVFLADQALHIGMIGLLLRFVTFSCYIDDYYVALKVVFVGLMLLMPCSILINNSNFPHQ